MTDNSGGARTIGRRRNGVRLSPDIHRGSRSSARYARYQARSRRTANTVRVSANKSSCGMVKAGVR